ncbi:MAG: hypothetical protein U0169_26145 [Polyangiaceae bacterium]
MGMRFVVSAAALTLASFVVLASSGCSPAPDGRSDEGDETDGPIARPRPDLPSANGGSSAATPPSGNASATPTVVANGSDAGATSTNVGTTTTNDGGASSASTVADAGTTVRIATSLRVAAVAVPLCADDITGNPQYSRIEVQNPGNSFTGGFKGDKDGAGGVNLFLTSYPVVKIYRAEDVAAKRPPVRVIDDPTLGAAWKRGVQTYGFALEAAELPAGAYLVALCASEAKDRCEFTHTYQEAEAEARARGYDEPWQAFFNLNNREGENRFGFIGGTDSPWTVAEGTATPPAGGKMMVLWSKNDGRSYETICKDDGHGGDGTISPLVLELGERTRLSSRERGVSFDLSSGEGARRVSWFTGADSFLLALDRNGNGDIDDGSELFGNQARGPSGLRASNGFEALAEYDANADGVLDAQDPSYSEIVAWNDAAVRNGRVDPGETFGLAELGVRSLSLDYVGGRERDRFGNVMAQESTCSVGPRNGGDDGAGTRIARVVDVWFQWE